MQNDGLRVSEQELVEQKKRAMRERAAEKRRKKTRDKHRAQGWSILGSIAAIVNFGPVNLWWSAADLTGSVRFDRS